MGKLVYKSIKICQVAPNKFKMVKKFSKHIELRFYGGLNHFLPASKRQVPFNLPYMGTPTVKDLIESVGVPHVEVFLIVADSMSVGFDYKPEPSSQISCYPRFYNLSIDYRVLRPPEPSPPVFILDVHLGRLASYLRLYGFDTLYSNCYSDDQILRLAAAENRIILTRDKGILRSGAAIHGYYVRSTQPKEQLNEVVDYFSMACFADPFSRCSLCNGLVETVDRENVKGLVAENSYNHYHSFYRCSRCGQIYWEGSQYKGILNLFGRHGPHHE